MEGLKLCNDAEVFEPGVVIPMCSSEKRRRDVLGVGPEARKLLGEYSMLGADAP